MQAIWFETAGKARDVLQYGERQKPSPAAGEVLVRLYATAVNPSDVKKRAGLQDPGLQNGLVIPHSDGAGVIESVGSGVDNSRIGERVWVYQAQFQRHLGTAAEYVAVDSFHAAPLPTEAGFDVGACMGIPAMTAHRCVFADGDVANQTVMITGASGRVGFYAAQWAKLAGARVIVTAGNPSRLAAIETLEADLALDYTRDDIPEAVDSFTDGRGVDRIIDVEFGMNAETSAQILKVNGVIATYSSSRAPAPVLPFYPFMFKNILLRTVLVYNMPDDAKQSAIHDIDMRLKNNELQHRIAVEVPLPQAATAHEAIEQGSLDGCAVMLID